ncbi:MAG: hypothetical protein OEM91_07340 [Hyphomicrobiales bacterium]|nr:hypothetical protein [Hyphomicrobiales bacterium]
MSQMTSPFRKDKAKPSSWNPTVSEERLLEAAKTDTTGQVDMASSAIHCPRFSVWPRDRLLTVYEVGRVGDALAIQHRGEITKTARECQIFPDKITIKYGFAGRLLLGPRGRPGRFTLPVKVHITDRTRNIVSTQNLKLNVTIAADNPIGFFSTVNQVVIPLPPGTPPSDYRLFVAFDRNAPGTG